MPASSRRWGADLRLLVNLERQQLRERGRDLSTTDPTDTGLVDLTLVEDVQNLEQALLLRFLTPVGELAALGHPTYGSRLGELIGERNVARTRGLAKLYVLRALGEEPRIRRVLSATVAPGARDRIDIRVSVETIDTDVPVNLVFPFFLEGGAA